MAAAIMAHPELRHPYPKTELGGDSGVTVLYKNREIHLEKTLEEPGLWVPAQDLANINEFELKPQGACLGELCIPLKEDPFLLKTVDGQQWINICAFADLLEQAWVFDTETQVFSFGDIPQTRASMLENAMAPDFEIVDRQGKVIRMSDFKGKKALIITWSSW